MKNFLALFLTYLISLNAIAVAPYGIKGQSQSGTLYSNVHQFPNNQVTNMGGINALVETGNKNILVNPSFEHSTFSTGWTNSAGTFAEDLIVNVDGLKAAKVTLSAQALALHQDSTLYQAQFADGIQGLAMVRVKTSVAGIRVCSRQNGVITSNLCVSVQANGKWGLYKVPFILGGTSNGISINSNSTSVTGDVFVDDAFLGAVDLKQDVDQSRIAGNSFFASNASCVPANSGATVDGFPVTAGCPGPTIEGTPTMGSWQTTDTDLPRQTINNLPAGTYKATFNIGLSTSADGSSVATVFDGTSSCVPQVVTNNSSSTINQEISCVFTYTSAGNRSFELYTGTESGSVSWVNNRTTTTPNGAGKFRLEYFGSGSVYSTADVNWIIDGNIGGANATVSGVVSSYTEITSASWDLALRPYSSPAKIACSATNASTGSTCAVGNEGVGIVFTPPSAGIYNVCISFSQQVTVSGNGQSTYQLVRTAPNSQEIIEEGGERIQGGDNQPAANNSGITPFKICGSFNLTDTNEVAIRLMTEKQFTNTATILADRAAAAGQRDIRVIVERANTGKIITGSFDGIEKCTDSYECTDTFSAKVSAAGVVSAENIDWINGNATVVTPTTTLTLKASLVTVPMNCTATGISSTEVIVSSNTVSSINVQQYSSSGTNASGDFYIHCQKQGADYIGKTAKAVASDQNLRTPGVTNAVFYSASITGTTGVVTNELGNFISTSACTNSSNTWLCDLSTTHSSLLNCTASTEVTNNYAANYVRASSTNSRVAFRVVDSSTGSGNATISFNVMCHGVQ